MKVAVAALLISGTAFAQIDPGVLETITKRSAELDTDALVVLHDGKPVLEQWFDGKPRRIQAMSVTKSVVSLAFGRLLTTGVLKSLDEPVSRWYPEWKQGQKRAITIRQLLNQTSGIQADAMTGTEINGSPDFIQLALCAELVSAPGTKFFYNNKATNLLAGLVQKLSGQALDQYLRKELFAPLGIKDVEWLKDPAGNPQGMSGLAIRPGDLAKLGQLMLDEGRWKGKQLLRADWVREATTGSSVAPFHGQLWWIESNPKLTIDESVLAEWREAQLDPKFIAAIEPLKDRVFTRDAFFREILEALKELGGEETWAANTWKRGVTDAKVVDSEVIGFRGEGWQGQHLIVLKQERLVVVRMREPSQGNTEEENKKFMFGELPRLVRKLVKTESATEAP